MSAAFKKGCLFLPGPVGLCLACLIIFTCSFDASSQGTSPNDVLLPPNPKLVQVHLPDLSKLEAEVREQILSAQNALVAFGKDPAITDEKLSEAYGALGQIYQAYALIISARDCYLNASRLSPNDFRWIYLLAKLDQLEGRFDDAVRHYQRARALRPEYVAAAVNLGNIYQQQNHLAEAEKSFKVALAIDEHNPAALYGLGQVALSRRNYSAAVTYFQRALARLPDANRIHYSLAMAYRGLGNAEKAKAHLAQQGSVGVRVNDPLFDDLQNLIRGARSHLVRGKLAAEARRYSDAADEFRKAIAANPNGLEAHINLGAVLTQTGDVQEAIAQFEQALRLDPNSATAHYNLAVLLANEARHEAAIAHLQSALSNSPNDLGARFFLAQELKRSGRLDDALKEFSRVAQENPDNEEALLEQAKLLIWKKQYRQALDVLEKGHAQYPRKGQTIVMLAFMLAASPQYDLRDGAKALELAQSVYAATASAKHGAIVAMALAESGRCDEAAAWLRQVIAKVIAEGKLNLAEKLKAEMVVYERARPCRPSAEMILIDELYSP